jgi:hypothetical protein
MHSIPQLQVACVDGERMLPVTLDEVVRPASIAVHLPGERVDFRQDWRVPNADEPNGGERAIKTAERSP